MSGTQGDQDMTWADALYNMVVPNGVAVIPGAGGIGAAKLFAGRAGKD
jgi:hypothetical protein